MIVPPVAALHQQAVRPTPAPLRDAIVIPPVDPAVAAQRELRTPLRYRLADGGVPQQNWFEQLAQWLWDRWVALIDALQRNVRIGQVGRVAIGDVLLVLFGGAVVLLAVRLLSSFVAVPGESEAAYASMGARKNARSLLLQATAAADRGDYAGAVRLLFVSAVTLLELRGVVRDDDSATVGELRGEVRVRDAALDPPFGDLARAFTATAYAERPADGGSWQRAREAYEALVRAAGMPA